MAPFFPLRRWLKSEFLENFKNLSIEEKADIAALDEQHILAAALLPELMGENYKKWIDSPNLVVKEMVAAIAIANGDFDAIDKTDESTLYRYFVNSRVEIENLINFSNPIFVTSMLNRLIIEERVIFTWIVQNLISMIQNSHLDPSQHKAFFSELFNKNSYIQGELSILFKEAILKEPNLFDELTRCQLSIDPFTKQIDYSLWLRDSAKFLYLEKLRMLTGIEATKQTNIFEQRLITFKKINKYDSAISSRG